MPDDGNGDQSPKLVHFLPWFYTIVIGLIGLYVVLFNPNNIVYNQDDEIGEAQVRTFGRFQTYPGQSAALQIMGTFIAAVGAVAHLLDIRIRRTGSIPTGVLIAAVIGPMLVVTGQVIQGLADNPLALVVLGVMCGCATLIWILAGAVGAAIKWVYPWLKRVYSWLKSRLKSGG